MGSWNHTCAVSNLHVTAGQEVVVFMLARNDNTYDTPWAVCPVPFYGKYDDYGGVEECHGHGMDIVVEAIRSQLYEFGQGANQYHDCEVRKDSFDIETLFKADSEDRLYIEEHYPNSWDADGYARRELEKQATESPLSASQQFELDRLANTLSRKVDPRRRLTHVVVHQTIVDEIKENWYIEDYVGDGKGTTGYGKNYNYIYFKDVIDSVPEFIERVKNMREEILKIEDLDRRAFKLISLDYEMRNEFDYKSTCYAGRYITNVLNNSEPGKFALIDIRETINDLVEANDYDSLEKFVREFLHGYWINMFMHYTRKCWMSTVGRGSQSQDHLGYTVLANAVLKVVREERAECEEDEDGESVS